MTDTTDERPALLVVTTTFPRYRDDPGPAPFVFHLARSLSAYFKITVLCPHDPGAAHSETMEGIEVRRFRYFIPASAERLADGKGMMNNLRNGILAKFQAVPLILAETLSALRLLRSSRFEYVNSHWLLPSGLIMAALSHRFRYRHILTVHAAGYFLLRRLPLGRMLLRHIMDRTDTVMCVSESIRGGLISLGAPARKIRVQPMGADLAAFRGEGAGSLELRERLGLRYAFVVLFVGKLSQKKGIEYLLDAAASLRERVGTLSLVIVGEGHLRESLEKKVDELGIADRVCFTGAVVHSELPDYYRMADVVAVPSVIDQHGESEGMPVVLLEGLAAGRPVVGTTLCAAPQTLKGRGFIEVAPADPAALAGAIEEVYQGQGPVVDRKVIRSFDWAEIAMNYKRAILGEVDEVHD